MHTKLNNFIVQNKFTMEQNPNKPFDEISDELDKRGLYWIEGKTIDEINEFAAQRLAIDTGISELCAKLQRSRMEFLEHLTETQFIAIITQMIKSGDFMRNVQGNKSSLSYVPFREKEELENEIKRLKEVLDLRDLNEQDEFY